MLELELRQVVLRPEPPGVPVVARAAARRWNDEILWRRRPPERARPALALPCAQYHVELRVHGDPLHGARLGRLRELMARVPGGAGASRDRRARGRAHA